MIASPTLRCLGALLLAGAGISQVSAAEAAPTATAEAAPVVSTKQARYVAETVVTGLKNPWAITWLPDGSRLVTERRGTLRVIDAGGTLLPNPISGTPKVWARGQGGMLDVEAHPDYAKNGWIYLAYSRPVGDGAITQIVRGRIKDGAWVDEEPIFTVPDAEATKSNVHFGSRIRFDGKGYVYFSQGERGDWNNAQKLDNHKGKVFRLHEDGRVPEDNPFVKTPGAQPEIWSYGHRNPQGLAIDYATGRIWETEHGPKGGDELNVIRKGANYGWPVITYGINYNGQIISDLKEKEGMEQPQHQWTPSIAASGLAFYTGEAFPEWKGDIFAGGLALQVVWRFELDGEKVVDKEIILEKQGRVRDVKQGPDGLLYIVFDEPGKIVRLVPAK